MIPKEHLSPDILGRRVVLSPRKGFRDSEEGILTGYNGDLAIVQLDSLGFKVACFLDDLDWVVPFPMLEVIPMDLDDLSSVPKFSHVFVQLIGEDGNAYYILGKVREALDKGGATQEQIGEFWDDATSSDYDHLLRVCMQWVNVT